MYYAPVLLFPLVTVLAGLGAAYGPAAARWLSTQPLVMVRPGRVGGYLVGRIWPKLRPGAVMHKHALGREHTRKCLLTLPPPCSVRAAQGLGPLAPLLAAAGGTQPWAGLLSVFASLLTALAGFVLEPVLDVLLGQDLRDPAEVSEVEGADVLMQTHAGLGCSAGRGWVAVARCSRPALPCTACAREPVARPLCAAGGGGGGGARRALPRRALRLRAPAPGHAGWPVLPAEVGGGSVSGSAEVGCSPAGGRPAAAPLSWDAPPHAPPPLPPHSTAATPPAAFLGATLSAGVAGGIQFTAAHELLHGQSRLDRACAGALLAAVGYMHWSESHLAHHVKVHCRRRWWRGGAQRVAEVQGLDARPGSRA